MSFLSKLLKPKVSDTTEKRRLAVSLKERPLREFFNTEHWEVVREAREQWFQNTPQIFKNTK